MLSEVSQREIQILYNISYMWNLKYSTTESMYKTETESHRKQLIVTKAGGVGGTNGTWHYSCKLLYIK